MTTDTLTVARRITKASLEKSLSCLSSARREATRLTEEAEARSADLLATAQRSADETNARLTEAERFLFEDEVALEERRRAATEAACVLDVAADQRAAFDAMETWLVPLVTTALERIIGGIAPDDLIAAQVRMAIAEARQRTNLNLRVSASGEHQLSRIMQDHPEQFAAVASVIPDVSLEEGELFLEDDGGIVDISLSTQISTFVDRIVQTAQLPREAS